MKLVFVYGTLKKGFWNHRLLSTSKYVTEAVLPNYKLFPLGGFPGIHPTNEDRRVYGEVYEVTDETLARLDRLEGIDHENPHRGMYRREEVVVYSEDGDSPWVCDVYVYNGAENETIESGVWR